MTTRTPVRETVVLWDLGYCMSCKRYRVYGGPCAECGALLEDRWRIEKEIEVTLAQLILATQHLFDVEPDVHRILDPRWRANAPIGVDGPAIPATEFSNAVPARAPGVDTVRGAIRVLRGIAAQHGVLPAEMSLAPQEGREVVVTLDGEEWLAFQNARTGVLRPLRKVEPSDAVAPAPGVACPECGVAMRGAFELAGHRKTHRAKERRGVER